MMPRVRQPDKDKLNKALQSFVEAVSEAGAYSLQVEVELNDPWYREDGHNTWTVYWKERQHVVHVQEKNHNPVVASFNI